VFQRTGWRVGASEEVVGALKPDNIKDEDIDMKTGGDGAVEHCETQKDGMVVRYADFIEQLEVSEELAHFTVHCTAHGTVCSAHGWQTELISNKCTQVSSWQVARWSRGLYDSAMLLSNGQKMN
jgi:hypothetical protein